MGIKHPKHNPISLANQMYSIKATYSSLIEKCYISSGVLYCTMNLKPSEMSNIYKIKINYKLSSRKEEYYPRVWLLEPELKKRDGKYPKHIYRSRQDANGNPCLCVFDPGSSEWDRQMYLSQSFIPWIVTWLNTYEYWLITGIWHYPESHAPTD